MIMDRKETSQNHYIPAVCCSECIAQRHQTRSACLPPSWRHWGAAPPSALPVTGCCWSWLEMERPALVSDHTQAAAFWTANITWWQFINEEFCKSVDNYVLIYSLIEIFLSKKESNKHHAYKVTSYSSWRPCKFWWKECSTCSSLVFISENSSEQLWIWEPRVRRHCKI